MTTSPGSENSLIDTLAEWRAAGYRADFSVDGTHVQCGVCSRPHPPAAAEILDVARFEGASDPDDEAALFALRCVHCGALGVLITAYGPSASAEEAAVMIALGDARY